MNEGYYDGLIFHRVINNFMIQGGGFTPDMVQKTKTPIKNEAKMGSAIKGHHRHGANHGPHSASAQFFINVADNGFLDHTAETTEGWGYCVLGSC